MKNILIGLAAMLLTTIASQSHAIPIVTLEASATEVTIGSSFEVNVVVSNLDPFDSIFAFGFDVSSDTDLNFIGASVGGDFFDDSALFLSTDVAGSAFPVISETSVTLASLVFLASSIGEQSFSITNDFFDFGFSEGLFTFGGTFDLSASSAITVTEPTSVPAPSTFLLLLAGMFGFRFAGPLRR